MNRKCVVTGAASGIGRATTLSLIEGGWDVIAVDISNEGLLKIAEGQDLGDRLSLLQCDIGDPTQVESLFRKIGQQHARLEALVACAGVLCVSSLESMSVEDYDLVFNVNTRGAWLCAREALPLLKRSATEQDPARVVFVSSVAALRPKVGNGVYAASKAALGHLTRIFAVECGASQILFNAVAPGTVDTPMIRNASDPASSSLFRPNGPSPLGRIASPEDVVRVIEFLLGDGARYVTGATIPVDGGTSAAYVPPSVTLATHLLPAQSSDNRGI